MKCENGVVVWDDESPAAFKAEYPEFAGVSDVLLARCFREATFLLNNSRCSLFPCCERIGLYNLLIAWLAFDYGRGAGLVGQISSASQGSVSLGMQAVDMGKAASPYMTNKYGELYWQATEKIRTMFYVGYKRPCGHYR